MQMSKRYTMKIKFSFYLSLSQSLRFPHWKQLYSFCVYPLEKNIYIYVVHTTHNTPMCVHTYIYPMHPK